MSNPEQESAPQNIIPTPGEMNSKRWFLGKSLLGSFGFSTFYVVAAFGIEMAFNAIGLPPENSHQLKPIVFGFGLPISALAGFLMGMNS